MKLVAASMPEQYALDRTQARTVAKQLAERLHAEALSIGNLSPSSVSSLTKKPSMLRSCPFQLPPSLSQHSQHREGAPMVLISLHPKQKHFVRLTHMFVKHIFVINASFQGENLQSLLEKSGYEVWLSTVVIDQDSDSEPSLFSQESLDHFEGWPQ
jgi:hypothetical protein